MNVDFLDSVPTLVVTGGWSGLYEEVAETLVAAGARHERLEGHFHRPQDHAIASDMLAAQWGASGL